MSTSTRVFFGIVAAIICALLGVLMYVFDVWTEDGAIMMGYMLISVLLVLAASWWFRRWGK